MGTYVENGNSCIGCSLVEEFPGECNGCHNLKSEIDLILIASDKDAQIKKLHDALKLSQSFINTISTGHSGMRVHCLGMVDAQRYDDALPIINEALKMR